MNGSQSYGFVLFWKKGLIKKGNEDDIVKCSIKFISLQRNIREEPGLFIFYTLPPHSRYKKQECNCNLFLRRRKGGDREEEGWKEIFC